MDWSGYFLSSWDAVMASATDDRFLVVIFGFLIGALLYRIRGGFLGRYLPGGTFSARMVWCVSTGLLCWWLVPDSSLPVIAVLVVLLDYAGLMIPHGRQMDMGRSNGTEQEDGLHLACIGVARLTLLLIGATFQDTTIDPLVLTGIVLAGMGHGVAYYIAWRLPVKDVWRIPVSIKGDAQGRSSTDVYLVDHECAWGELIWGGIQYVALILCLPRFSIIPDVRILIS